MQELKPIKEEIDGRELIEDVNQLKWIGFGEGAAMCQVCGSSLREGEGITAYAFRPVSQVCFQVWYVLCLDHLDAYSRVWTLGVREVIVRGRVGRVVDQARQSSWRVVLEPRVVAVSSPDESGCGLGGGGCAGRVGGGA